MSFIYAYVTACGTLPDYRHHYRKGFSLPPLWTILRHTYTIQYILQHYHIIHKYTTKENTIPIQSLQHHTRYFSHTRISIPYQGIILRKAWSPFIIQIWSESLPYLNLVQNNLTSLTLYNNYQQKQHLINFARSPLPQASVLPTDSKKSFTLTDFSVPDHLGIREIKDKSFGAVGLAELTWARRLLISACKFSTSFSKLSVILTTPLHINLFSSENLFFCIELNICVIQYWYSWAYYFVNFSWFS